MKKKKNKKKHLSITVGIPTCYGGESLLATVRTLYASQDIKHFRLVIVADRTPIEKNIRRELKRLGAEIYWNKEESGQFKKLKEIIEKSRSDIFIYTQDDITFDRRALIEIRNKFEEDPDVTMLGIRILPLPPITFFDSVMAVSVRIVDRIGRRWNRGDNHLTASGRCLAFRAKLLKKFRIPESVVNGDAFLYLENKRLRGEYKQLSRTKVYIRCPQTFSDQIGPSSRYQFSKQELSSYFHFDIRREYEIPKHVIFHAVMEEFLDHPFQVIAYLFVFVYTRFRRQSEEIVINPIWQIDKSTKQIHQPI